MRKNPWLKRKNLFSSPVPKVVEKPKVKWRILPILWMAFKRTCTFVGGVVLITAIFTSMMVSSVIDKETNVSLPEKMVLVMNLEGEIGDLPKKVSLVDPLAERGAMMKSFIDAIYRAKDDPRVDGIYARLGQMQFSLAHIQELRKALHDFRSVGKFTYIYAPSYSGGLGQYYMVSAFEEIWMQPMGIVAITGLNAEMPFLRNVLDKVGIEPQFMQRKEYKSAYESLTNAQMSDASREAMSALIGDIADTIKADISKDRGIAEGDVKKLVDMGVLLSQDALDGKLISVVDYEDQLIEKINKDMTGDAHSEAPYVDFSVYAQGTSPGEDQDMLMQALQIEQEDEQTGGVPRVALIYAVGAIMDTDGSSARVGGVDNGIAAADEISAALLEAAEDYTINAVVLRVNSPGGSPIASETILRAVEKVKEQGKSVIVSMGPAAASGGYWISASADQIFVLPSTLTGSIGVLGGKVSAQKLWENIGVQWDGISWGENSGIWSMNTPFSESEAQRMSIMLDHIYDNFIERVAKGRDMSIQDVEKIARGRVWSGKRAVEIGIADQFGGLNEALDYAAKQAGGTNRHDVDTVILPKPLTALEQFIKLLEGQVIAGEMIGSYGVYLKQIEPIIREWNIVKDPQNHSVYNPIRLQ
ncbi:MAG: signal peptide peptidase SppA [Alphaproteobacteria bacterium]